MMTLWTGSKELYSTSDDKIGPNEEEEQVNGQFQTSGNHGSLKQTCNC